MPGVSREAYRLHQLRHSLPPTTWQMPTEFPNLSDARVIGVDIESKDPHIMASGPGFVRRDAHVIGVAVSAVFSNRESFTKYYPVRHDNGANIEPAKVFSWLREQLRGPQPKVGANLLYDLEGLHFEGVKVEGPIHDIQIAGPLIDENKDSYALDVVAKELLGRGKDEKLLKTLAKIIGVEPKQTEIKRNLYKIPAEYVGPYAEEDCRLGIEVLAEQTKKLEEQGMLPVFRKESRLIPLLLKMRIRGVPVDIPRAEEVNERIKKEEADKQRRLNAMVGFHLDVWSALDVRRACIDAGIPFNRTEVWSKRLKDFNPSFTADWFRGREEPFLKLIAETRKMSKMRRDFVEGFILNLNIGGRLHCEFHQLRKTTGGEDGSESTKEGTRSGRFSSTNPNLQQIPSRDPVFGPMVRSLFIPEPGEQWCCADYSAQEPRVTVHYAYLRKYPGAAEAVRQYINNPDTDYHRMVAEWASISRPEAKIINLGLAYGMGFRKLAYSLGFLTLKEMYDRSFVIPEDKFAAVSGVLDRYHEGVPYIKPLMQELSRIAERRGYIRTLWGRRRRFDDWIPRNREDVKSGLDWKSVKGYQAARDKFGNIPLKRDGTHKSLNGLIQGGSADMMKEAMLQLGDLGYVPFLTVHDEIDDSVGSAAQAREIHDVMVGAIKLAVPLKVDLKVVENWGKAK